MDTYQKIQNNKFILDESIMEGHHEKSFYQKYINSV